jgi:hypothetical protein
MWMRNLGRAHVPRLFDENIVAGPWTKLIALLLALAVGVAVPLWSKSEQRTITRFPDEPEIWTERGFLSDEESAALIAELNAHSPSCWEQQPSGLQATCSLEGDARSRPLGASALGTSIDARIAAKLGVPLDWLEHGYVQRYHASYSAHNLHLDQGEQAMDPARVASAIVYLDSQPRGSGHTVFPFVDSDDSDGGALRSLWEGKLQAGRILSRFFRPAEYGAALFARGAEQCARGGGQRPERGTALFFRHRTAAGRESIAALHGSCSMAAGAPLKHALVKLACDGRVREETQTASSQSDL